MMLGAVVLGGAGLASPALAGPAAGSSTQGTDKRPVKVYDLALKGTSTGQRELPRTKTHQFSLVGVSWTGAAKPLDGTAQVRTRTLHSGAWSAWHDLEVDASRPDKPDAQMRGASAPLWVGPSDGIQAQVLHKDGTTAALPKGLEVNLVDPGVVTAAETQVSKAQPAVSAAQSTASQTSAAAQSTLSQPPVTSRAGWGANESLSPDPSQYNPGLKTVFVHHTDGANDYSCTESASIVRGIYAYHTQVNKWNDIGYHFLVDKCGTVFEGRKGGIDKPVLGAHTYGFNRESTGIAILGRHTSATATDAALASVSRMAAWKLALHGADPAGTVALTAGATQTNYFAKSFTAGTAYTFPRISAHRDGYNTQCPGNSLYAQLPTIRTWAAGPVQNLKITALTGATRSGSTYYTKGPVTVRWSATTPAPLIKSFEVLVDGTAVAGTSGAATAATVTLPAGTHTVALRAIHQSGRTATTAPLRAVTDTAPPTFTAKPNLSLRTGTVNTTAVPVTLRWQATDDKAMRYTKLLSPTAATFTPATTASSRTVTPGTTTTWSLRAYDYAGNYRTASAASTPVLLQETSAATSGSWTTRSSTNYLGGKSYSSATKGAALTWTFTGRSASWVVSRASSSGQAHVYVDGVKTSTVDLKSSTPLYRQAIWTKTWPTSATRTVKIVVAGTSGRPTITTDGLASLR
ncbi:peptidoglycan recognition protein [Streptomyces sp. NPDC126514]|uniref:peptidoglycan recognition protein family protein n=1 Tax=Streptomyces sp. NPDC126514 TaxID=3155210 RepID=UPI0033336A1F